MFHIRHWWGLNYGAGKIVEDCFQMIFGIKNVFDVWVLIINCLTLHWGCFYNSQTCLFSTKYLEVLNPIRIQARGIIIFLSLCSFVIFFVSLVYNFISFAFYLWAFIYKNNKSKLLFSIFFRVILFKNVNICM